MIRGVIQIEQHGANEHSILASTFSECCQLLPHGARASVGEQLKHFQSEQLRISVAMGGSREKSLVMTHLTCSGANCSCIELVNLLLFSDDIRDDDIPDRRPKRARRGSLAATNANEVVRFLEEGSIDPPFSMVLSANGYASCITHLCEGETKVIPLTPGWYSIRYAKMRKKFEEYSCLVHITVHLFPSIFSFAYCSSSRSGTYTFRRFHAGFDRTAM